VSTQAWVLLDESNGAKTSDGSAVTPAALAAIAGAIRLQQARDYSPECGGPDVTMRAGSGRADIQSGERVFALKDVLPDAPGAIAYHSVDGAGVAFALLAVTTCDSLLGSGASVSSAVSHEVCETAGDEGCNCWADRGDGIEVAHEECDAVEVQSYAITLADGTPVFVSNFLLPAFWIPAAPGPYSYMAKAALPGAVDPPGPMQTAPASGGNYQTQRSSGTGETSVNAMHRAAHVHGTPRNPGKVAHWSSRASRRGVRA
jgi:hypothetical protein